MKEKVYLIHSEYVQNGMIFNSHTRYVKDKEKAIRIYEETLQKMKEDNADMISDKENYRIDRGVGRPTSTLPVITDTSQEYPTSWLRSMQKNLSRLWTS